MPLINVQPRDMQDGTRITYFSDTVGTSSTTYTFQTEQEAVTLKNKGSKDLNYTIGSYTGILGQGEFVKVTGAFTSLVLSSAQGTQRFEVLSDESGTVGTTPEAVQSLSDKVTSFDAQLAEKATKVNVDDIALNIRDFGAKLDGVTNDAQPLKDALASLPTTGGTILIPKGSGDCLINNTIIWKSNVRLVGTAGKPTIKRTVTGGRVFDFSNCDNVGLKNFKVVGQGVDTGSGDGIYLNNTTNSIFEDLEVMDFENQNISLNGNSTGNKFTNIRTTGAKKTTSAGCGLVLWGNGVKNNTFEDIYAKGNRLGVSVNGGENNRFGKVKVEYNRQTGFTIDGVVSNSGDGGKRNTVGTVIAYKNGYNLDDTVNNVNYGGVYLGNGASDNTFESIISTYNAGQGLYLYSSLGDVVNNVFGKVNCKYNQKSGVLISSTNKNSINEVIAENNTLEGIDLYKSSENNISMATTKNNTGKGVRCFDSNKNIFLALRSANNTHGIHFYGTDATTRSKENRVLVAILETNSTSDMMDESTNLNFVNASFT